MAIVVLVAFHLGLHIIKHGIYVRILTVPYHREGQGWWEHTLALPQHVSVKDHERKDILALCVGQGLD
jgi:hypothetical protein